MSNYYSTEGVGVLLNGLVDDGVLQELADNGEISWQSPFTGEAFPVGDDGNERWGRGRRFSDDAVYYVEASRYPTLFRAAYPDMAALVAELEASCLAIPELPKDIDVRKNLVILTGTCYG